MAGTLTADGRRARDTRLAIVACEFCPRVFTVRQRRLREIVAGRARACCETCRAEFRKGGRPSSGYTPGGQLVVDDAMRLFWLERFTPSEIREIAVAAWGPPPWGEGWRQGFLFVGSPDRLAA